MASNLHLRCKKLLKEIFGTTILEEVNVRKLFKGYKYSNHHYDLVIPLYEIIVECHGIQHKEFQTFGEKDIEKSLYRFQRQKSTDFEKKRIALENEWNYVSVWYNELPSDDSEAKKVVRTKIMDSFGRSNDA
jgi:hypothetical protein